MHAAFARLCPGPWIAFTEWNVLESPLIDTAEGHGVRLIQYDLKRGSATQL